MIKLEWDKYSDQPRPIKDRKIKSGIYKKNIFDFIKTLSTNLLFYPLCFTSYLLLTPSRINTSTEEFFGLSINLDKRPNETRSLVDDLGVNNLLIRLPLSDIENIKGYVDFCNQYRDKNILINILQDRRHVEDSKLLKSSLDKVFSSLSELTCRFQLGNAINRKKWAFFSMDEFLKFYKTGYDLRNEKYPDLELLGPSVIDFEYYFSIRVLFNLYDLKFDQVSSLLYVDRRGAPENSQLGLDLTKKLHFLQAITRLSPKAGTEIVISETNWPLTNTHPYAPTGEGDCVTKDQQAAFLVRYYLLGLASGVVRNIYWHQLIAPGYGLVDDRHEELIKHPSYFAFKFMLKMLNNAEFIRLNRKNKTYNLSFFNPMKKLKIEIYWKKLNQGDIESTMPISGNSKAFSCYGEKIDKRTLSITELPVYVINA